MNGLFGAVHLLLQDWNNHHNQQVSSYLNVVMDGDSYQWGFLGGHT
jgi:hypothetical protein